MFTNAPPEFPDLWQHLFDKISEVVRVTGGTAKMETMPRVTEEARLNGLPIAIAQSPGRSLSESPR